MQKQGTAVVCTMRQNRIKARFPKSTFQKLTKKPGKRDFRRNIKVFQAKTGPNKYIQLQFYYDKCQKSPVIFSTNDPFLFQSSDNDQGNRNITKL